MTKRHSEKVYKGMCYVPEGSNSELKSWMSLPSWSDNASTSNVVKAMMPHFWTAYASINSNYVAVVTICVVVLLSFLLPDISEKIAWHGQLKSIRKALKCISREVSQAEVTCHHATEKLSGIKGLIIDGTTQIHNEGQDIASTYASCIVKGTQSLPVKMDNNTTSVNVGAPCKNTSYKEVTLMSYLYTDSFDNMKNK